MTLISNIVQPNMSIEVLKRAPDELVQAAKRTKQELQKVSDNMPPRTSDLSAPIMHLTGHAAEVNLLHLRFEVLNVQCKL